MLFRCDMIVDLVTYRRWGRNELDEPAFIHPTVMHKDIHECQTVPKMYEEKPGHCSLARA